MKKAYDPIPKTVADALKKWDSGDSVFSVSMGGMGPGYEMAIQGLAFEMMRRINGFKGWENKEKVKEFYKKTDEVIHKFDKEPWGGFSGAQVGAARSLASIVCRRGYRKALRDKMVKDRLIQVSKKDLRGASMIQVKDAR